MFNLFDFNQGLMLNLCDKHAQASLHLAFSATKCGSEPMNFEHVVNYRKQLPLDVYLGLASQCKSAKFKNVPYVSKHRFNRSNSFAINRSTFFRIDLFFHPLGKCNFGTPGSSREIGNSSNLGRSGYLKH